jgi:hypothetical protein
MPELPDCDDLFLQFFDRWYSDDARRRRMFKTTFPDMLQDESYVGLSQAEASRITEEGQQTILAQIDELVEAARGDWPTYLAVSDDIDVDWIDAFDRHHG